MKKPNSAALHDPKDHKKKDPPRGTDGAKAVEITPTTPDNGNPRNKPGRRRHQNPPRES